MADTLYDLLGVAVNCDFAALKKAYYARAKLCHPDLFGNSAVKTEEFKRLVAAFNTLSNPELRRRYDSKILPTAQEARDRHALLGTEADDILEELIVGNNAPPETSLATLMADLTKTEVFVTFREGKDHFAHGRMRSAERCFRYAVGRSPGNILYRVFMARAFGARRRYRQACREYRTALALGMMRIPRLEMTMVRREYEEMRRRRHPVWRWISDAFRAEPARLCEDASDAMVRQLNRSIAARLRAADKGDTRRLE